MVVLKIRRKCPICGKDFYVLASRVKFKHGKYCSVECVNKAVEGSKGDKIARLRDSRGRFLKNREG